ncbi:MAG: methyl-accepting chemotaxis protein [ANME-2 cluster archaeon]|nr:methyl-accepting chemotaxis protein [ANME-2 cluster archaeon]
MSDTKRMTIKKTLVSSFLAFAVLMAIIGTISVYNIITMQDNVDEILEIRWPLSSIAYKTHDEVNHCIIMIHKYLLVDDYPTRQQIRQDFQESLLNIESYQIQIVSYVDIIEDKNAANNLLSSQKYFEEIAMEIMDMHDSSIVIIEDIGNSNTGLGGQMITKSNEMLAFTKSLNIPDLCNKILELQSSESQYLFEPTNTNAQKVENLISSIKTDISASDLDDNSKDQLIQLTNQNSIIFSQVVTLNEQLGENDIAQSELLYQLGSNEKRIHMNLDDILSSNNQIQLTIKDKVQNNIRMSIIMVALATLLVLGLVMLMLGIIQRVIRSISDFGNHVNHIAKGDLTHKIDVASNDEIGDLAKTFIKMKEDIKKIITNIKDVAITVGSTAQELAASSEELSATTEQVSSKIQLIAQGANDQAREVENMSRELVRLSQTTDEISSTVDKVKEFSEHTNEMANTSSVAAKEAMDKLEVVKEKLADSASAVEGLGVKSRKISSIVDVITSIADQTNLLALNAAIEAARAGEQGRGFAVVAAEVRNLAEESKKAAEQIDALIKEISEDTNNAVKYTEVGTSVAAEGIEMTSNALHLLENISEAVNETATRIKGITDIVEAQKVNTDNVVNAMDRMASIVDDNLNSTEESAASTEEQTASMEELTSSAQELAQLANNLQESVSKFKVS